jgi:hypothetical protein
MKKTLLSIVLSLAFTSALFAQSISNDFFDKVSYIGAFDGTIDWTKGWTNFDPVNTAYAEATETKGNGQFSRSAGVHITANETWKGVIKLDGWVFVDAGATLTIEAGTIIRGTSKSVVSVERGAKIMAVGTLDKPIVFTSNQGAGFRANSDWAGLVICGKGINNNPGGEGIAEGGIDSPYGGTDNEDNSGVLKYVRIEFPGYEVASGKEINGLTFYSVGSKTSIDYVQVSHSGDDGYEWFGGAVNAKHLISYKTEDDDFDTDNGFSGMIQYGLVLRDPNIVDTDAANTFESDNDAAGSTAEPFTKAIFSNISAFGPAESATSPASLLPNHAGGSGMRLRKSTHLQIYNAIFMGWGQGLRIESDNSQTAANADVLTVQNTILAGTRGTQFVPDSKATVMDAAAMEAWYKDAKRKNSVFATNQEVKIASPFNYSALNFQPLPGSPALDASIWFTPTNNNETASINNSFFDKVSYTGAFGELIDWTKGWANFDPQNANYAEATIIKGNGQFSRSAGAHITANETWSGVIKLDGWVFVDAGATLTIEPGTIIRGTSKSLVSVERGAKIMAVGTVDKPIVFTSNQGAGFRSQSDWAGLVICGKGLNNNPGGEGIAEGGIDSPYGGTIADDNSGVLKYVRIEFPGYEVASGKEINGLTLYSVGSKTAINYVQVSYSGDDGYEWFGGSVNSKYLISYRTEDDDFDTDNGFVGMVQYAAILRDPNIVDTDAANAFESDNDAAGSATMPITHAVFSNISAFGPSKSATDPATLLPNHAGGSAMRLRKSTQLQIFNSAFLGWGQGLRIESDNSQNAANADLLTVQNSIIAGSRGLSFVPDSKATVMDAAAMEAWYKAASRKNQLLSTNEEAKVTDAFNLDAPNFLPMSGSPLLKSSYWNEGSSENEPVSINHSFFDKVRYIGGFDGNLNWTSLWANFDPQNTNYPDATITKGNGQFSRSAGAHITGNETWSGVIKLDGWVFVDAGATLTINPGTIIRGTSKSLISVERGAKIMAVGTAEKPIVFTSNQGAGFRAQSDWAGVVICGKAYNNNPGNEGIAEGGIDSPYGGTIPDDNSGELKYVRIEFPGYEVATGKEINGLSLYAVGSKTKINFVQVSYSGDDAYEWFGGSVNAKYLISYRTEDDDFDTDNGYSGMVQFGLIQRDPNIVDTDAANAFESDNDAAGSTTTPFTTAIFSNISAFGPSASATSPATLLPKHAEGSAMRLRKNTRLQIYNALFMGWGQGLRIESDGSQTAANADILTVQNTTIAGSRGLDFVEDSKSTVMNAAAMEAWYKAPSRRNKLYDTNDEVKIPNAFNYDAWNFQPVSASLVFDISYWVPTAVSPLVSSDEMDLVNYPNPFSGSTTIELQLKNNSFVRIFVVDLAGRTVSKIQEGNLTEGTHQFEFDGSNLPKGIYVAKVITDNSQKAVKMISK